MSKEQLLDPEWVNLIIKAKQLGLSMDEIRSYLETQSTTKKVTS
ncbi:anti-repressor SinI family protein [Pontibacillus litoralis]|uniref:Sin domain-containing protein n=1 Tax=Pontibacillus litoralis JSM 072002 TaxID=1385512 RepID=A0A0A5FZ56_9BACI|nr:anti-repressor SinI family protein [Pontibacillus litoralis]KGX86121.1 hypothetical protein N784_06035 [Pontibacillus litoralis JSM 072002]